MTKTLFELIQKNHSGQVVYVYDLDGIFKRLKFMLSSLNSNYKIHYAVKANHFPGILNLLKNEKVGVDVVSGGEYRFARELGFAANEVVFSGVGKSKSELRLALKDQVGQINIESESELRRIIDLSAELNLDARIAIRVNPDVEAKTHPYIRTGLLENKFGIDFESAKAMAKLIKNNTKIKMQGLSLHIGSQIREVSPFKESIQKSLDLLGKIQNDLPAAKTLDIGGGLGIDYQKEDLKADENLWSEYVNDIRSVLDPELKSGRLEKVLLEPGRFLVARFGTLFAQVEYVKPTQHKNFLIVNTGMHHLIRPMLYQAFHRIECVNARPNVEQKSFDVVGPICESTDTLGRDRLFPADIQEGEWIKIMDTGAYANVMKSDYNLQPAAVELAISQGKFL